MRQELKRRGSGWFTNGDPDKRQYKKWSIYVNSMMEPGGKWGIKRIRKTDTGRNPSTNFGNLSFGNLNLKHIV